VLLVVVDSLGVGPGPDTAAYGDAGSNTLGNTAAAVGSLTLPNLGALGIGALTDVAGVRRDPAPGSAHGTAAERSPGKDTTTGHWEMMGVVLDRPFPLYPSGFPPEVLGAFEERIGRRVLGNRPASGTEILAELGPRHLETGEPIVYTSGDSVFQIAAHIDVVDLATLYEWCRTARRILTGPHEVGRVIARPFAGRPGAFERLAQRRDFSAPPPRPTVLDALLAAEVQVYGVGKIRDIFAGQGLTEARYSSSDQDGVDVALSFLERSGPSLVFVNLVDLDSKYGHRNDPPGYARALEAIDARVPELITAVGEGVLLLTGDHGCDPTTPSTDHSRELVPVLAAGLTGGPYDIGRRETFADVGATVADLLGATWAGRAGTSFAREIGR
jgi:phosphopentomutase